MYQLARLLTVLAVLLAVYSAVIASVMWPLAGVMLGAAAIGLLMRGKRGRLTTLGSAKWADTTDLSRAGMLGANSGLIIGRLQSASKATPNVRTLINGRTSPKDACSNFYVGLHRGKQELVRLPQAIHTAVFSPSGGGKGVSVVMPHCMTCADSMVILDPKGEIARATARLREKRFGQQIVLLDAYKQVTQTPDSYNPVDFIDVNNSQAIEQCRNMGNAVVVRSPDEREPHWTESAAMWFGGVTGMVVLHGKRNESRSVRTAYEFVSHAEKRALAVKLMRESTCWNGTLASWGDQLAEFLDKEKASVMTTIARNLSFLGTPAVMASVHTSSFDPALLRAGKMTVYLILPPSHQRTQAGLMRLWLSSLMENVVSGGLQE
jgi:type IV secretion system protein VirD4